MCQLICTHYKLEKLKLNGTVTEIFIDTGGAYNSWKFVIILFEFDTLFKFVKLIKTC
jgi:hypothetical protein